MDTTLLYLEDDDALAFVTKRSLERKGIIVHHFATLSAFEEGLKTFEFSHALLDLKIGTDTSMELIGQIKSRRNIPIVIITGYGTIRTAVQAMKLGAVNFLSKPCGIDEIIEALLVAPPETQAHAPDELEKPSLKAIERETIQRALDENNGNISAAARQLKMHRRTLQRKLQKRHTDS